MSEGPSVVKALVLLVALSWGDRHSDCQAAGPLHIHLWGHPQKQAPRCWQYPPTTAGSHQDEKFRLWAFSPWLNAPCAKSQSGLWVDSVLFANVNLWFHLYSNVFFPFSSTEETQQMFSLNQTLISWIYPIEGHVMKIHATQIDFIL